MVSLTPHRDAVEQGLADMKARFDAGGTPEHPALQAEQDLTLALTQAAMRYLGDKRDQGLPDSEFGGAFTASLGNVMCSVAETLTNGSQPLALILLNTFVNGAMAQALRALVDQSPDAMNEVRITRPTTGRA